LHFLQSAIDEGKLPQNYYDRALLVTVLGEIPDQISAMKAIFDGLKPGDVLSVAEVIADPHFQRRNNVSRAATSAGFVEKDFFDNRIDYTIHFEKPTNGSSQIAHSW
jgi:hypothetical protein